MSEVERGKQHAQNTSPLFEQDSFAPFEISKVFGINPDAGVKLLKEDEDNIFLYAMGQFISWYNITSKQQTNISVHENLILAIECDLKGRFMITCDKKCAVIWDLNRMKKQPTAVLRVFRKPFGDFPISAASMSSSGKYILLMSAPEDLSEYMVQLWLWSFERRKCDAYGVISKDCGKFKSFRFSTNEGEDNFFVITFSHAVAFSLFDSGNGTLQFHIPEKKNFQELNASCYVPNCRRVVSVTSRGLLVAWSDLQNEILNKPVSNEKSFVKSILLRKCSINDVNVIDDLIATVDNCGEVRFYDNEIRLVYKSASWGLPEIRLFTSSLQPIQDFRRKCEYPKDYTPEAKPFIIRNFVIVTTNGYMAYCDAVQNTIEMMNFHCEGIVVATDHHSSDNAIIFCNSSGRITFFNYENSTKIADYTLDEVLEIETTIREKRLCTSLKLSPCGSYLAIGFNDGILCLLDPIVGKFVANLKPTCFSTADIDRIVFGQRGFLVYTDTDSTTVLVHFKENIELIGKYRFHCAPIVGVFFTNQSEKLVTVSVDRFLVEYNTQGSSQGRGLEFIRDVRLEQSAEITAAAMLPAGSLSRTSSKQINLILIANNLFKLRFFDSVSLDCVRTVLGPIFESPIRQLILKPMDSSNSLLIFATQKTLGVALTPLDGNPFRYSGVMAHYSKIQNISTTKYVGEIFVQGEGDCGGTIWELKTWCINSLYMMGGEGLVPFCTLLPGGKDGWLFKEMQDFFIYMQLMSAVLDTPEDYMIKDSINLTDLIDFLRAIGYFPSEWEIKTLKSELTTNTKSLTILPTKISFADAVKVYLNHKPVDGYKLDDISGALQYIVYEERKKPGEQLPNLDMSLEKILELLIEKAESIPRLQALQFLFELLKPTEKWNEEYINKSPEELEHILTQLHSSFNIETFCKILLGIEIDSSSGGLCSVFGDQVSSFPTTVKLDSISSEECLEDNEISYKEDNQIS